MLNFVLIEISYVEYIAQGLSYMYIGKLNMIKQVWIIKTDARCRLLRTKTGGKD